MMNLNQLGGKNGLMGGTPLFFSSILGSNHESNKQKEMLWSNQPDLRFPKMDNREVSLYSSGKIYLYTIPGEGKSGKNIKNNEIICLSYALQIYVDLSPT